MWPRFAPTDVYLRSQTFLEPGRAYSPENRLADHASADGSDEETRMSLEDKICGFEPRRDDSVSSDESGPTVEREQRKDMIAMFE